ncbi:MAG TPA: hypothetical protein DDX91_09075 [Ruminococcaceae bacterium]|nr:hypothetical protein [Oscillospiraceae bacterium]
MFFQRLKPFHISPFKSFVQVYEEGGGIITGKSVLKITAGFTRAGKFQHNLPKSEHFLAQPF